MEFSSFFMLHTSIGLSDKHFLNSLVCHPLFQKVDSLTVAKTKSVLLLINLFKFNKKVENLKLDEEIRLWSILAITE